MEYGLRRDDGGSLAVVMLVRTGVLVEISSYIMVITVVRRQGVY